MTDMIKTPLGQYINPDKIYTIYIAENGLIKQVGQPPKTIETIPSTEFWIEVIYTDNTKQILSLDYKTKEEAQKELDNMMGPAPTSYPFTDKDINLLDLIDSDYFRITKYNNRSEPIILEIEKDKDIYTLSDTRIPKIYPVSTYSDIIEAIKSFNSIDV